jgi:hypothetical protein
MVCAKFNFIKQKKQYQNSDIIRLLIINLRSFVGNFKIVLQWYV